MTKWGHWAMYSAANDDSSYQRFDRLANERQGNELSLLRRVAAGKVRQFDFLVYRYFKLERTKRLVCELQGQAFPLFVVPPVDSLDCLSSETLGIVGTAQLTHRHRQSSTGSPLRIWIWRCSFGSRLFLLNQPRRLQNVQQLLRGDPLPTLVLDQSALNHWNQAPRRLVSIATEPHDSLS